MASSCSSDDDASSWYDCGASSATVPADRSSPVAAARSLLGTHVFVGIEQRDWENDIRWDDEPTPHPQQQQPHAPGGGPHHTLERGFASLATLHLQAATRPQPQPIVKEEKAASAHAHAPPSAAELAAKFTYLPSVGGATAPVGTWHEVGPPPCPVLVSSTAPTPPPPPPRPPSPTPSPPAVSVALPTAVAALTVPASSPPATAAYAAQLPFYNNPIGPAAFALQQQQNTAAAAAAFMSNALLGSMGINALSGLNNNNAATISMINAYGMQMQMAQMQQMQQVQQQQQQQHAHAQQQLLAQQQQQQLQQQQERLAAQRAAELAALQPAVRVPIKFRVATKSTPRGLAPLKPLPTPFQDAGIPAAPFTSAKRLSLKSRRDPTHRPSFPQKNLPQAPPSSGVMDPWSFVASVPSTAVVPTVPSVLTTAKFVNREFASMAWLDDVLWDDYASLNDEAFHAAAFDESDPHARLPAPLPHPPRSLHTRLIWDANDVHMIFETSEQLEAAARKERARLAKLEEAKDEEEKMGGNRFNISQDIHYDQDQAFTSHARTERVRVPHALFAADLEEGPFEWYRTREHVTIVVPLYPRNWHGAVQFNPDEGQIGTHRPRLPKALIQALLQKEQKARLIPDKLVSKDHWLEVVSDRYHVETSAARRDNKIVPESLEDMSMTEGGLVLLEYLEQFPLLNLHIGMASRLVTYYRKTSEDDEKQVDVPDGDVILLSKTEQSSPFLGEIKPGSQVTAINNNLFIAPIHRHPVPKTITPTEAQSTSSIRRDLYCTFMLVRVGKKWHLRNLPTPYTVGQLEPKKAVPQPNHDAAMELQRKYIECTIQRAFHFTQQVRLDDLVEQFGEPGNDPDMRQFIKFILRELGAVDLRGGVWQWPGHKELPSIERLRRVFSPEDFCIYEAMVSAHHRLRAMGITSFTGPRLVSNLLGHIRMPHLLRVARFIEKQLELTPWLLTKGFVQCTIEEKGVLMLEGRGNPLADGAGYSYLVVDKKKEEEDMPEELKEVKKKTGTDADLRRLTGPQLENALLKFGMSPAEIKPLHRWERVRRVAAFSTQASAEGKYVTMRRFQRHVRQSLQAQVAEFKRAVNKIFDKQLNTISFAHRPDYTHEVNDDPAAVSVDAAAASSKLLKSSALTEQRQEAEEARQYQEFIEQQNASTNTHDAKKEEKKAAAAAAEDAAAQKKKTRTVKRKRVKHATMTIKPDGTRETHVRYIIHPQLIAYHESDARDGGARLRMALGLLSGDEIADLRNRGGSVIPRLSQWELDHEVYERNTGESLVERGETTRPRRGGGRPRGSGAAGRASFIERAEREERGERTAGYGRGRGRGRPRVEREHHGDDTDDDEEVPSRGRGRGLSRAVVDSDEEDEPEPHHDDEDEEDDDFGEEEEPQQKSLNMKDATEQMPDGTFQLRCGACGDLGHAKDNLICRCTPKEKAIADDIIYYDDERPAGGRGRPAARREEEQDDAVAKGLIGQGAGGALKLNLKGISAVPQTAPRRPEPPAAGRKGKRERASEDSWQPSKRASGVGVRKRGDAKVSLNSALQVVVDYAINSGVSGYFQVPVTASKFPDYAGIIGKKAIDLRTIRQNTQAERYESREQFLADCQRIVTNSEVYNGPLSMVTVCARELLVIINQQMKKPAAAAKMAEAEHQYAYQQLHSRLQACVQHMRLQPGASNTFGFVRSDVPGYLEKIREPMALGTLTDRILGQAYTSVGEFVYDLQLIASNAALFNGPQHEIAKQAADLVTRGLKFLGESFAEDEMKPQSHDIPPPTFARQSSSLSSVPTPATAGRLTTPRLTTPRRTTPRRNTPDRKKTPSRSPGPATLASPAQLRMGTAGGPQSSSRANAAANSPVRLQFAASPVRLEVAKTTPRPLSSARAPTSGAAASASIPASVAPPSPARLPEMMDMSASDMSAFLPADDDMLDVGNPFGGMGMAMGLGMGMGGLGQPAFVDAGMGLGLDQLPDDSALDLGELPPE